MVRIHPDPPEFAGAVAQLGEHLLCKQGVVGSIPSSSTSRAGPGQWWRRRVQKQAAGCPTVLFASGFLNQRYRLFFNNTEEVKQSCPTGEAGGASLLSRAWGGMGWIVSSPLFPEGGSGG